MKCPNCGYDYCRRVSLKELHIDWKVDNNEQTVSRRKRTKYPDGKRYHCRKCGLDFS